MPTYSYACTECDDRFDIVQAFTDDALTTCEKCSGRLRKLFNSVGVVFKGSGFYRTDSREIGKKSTSSTNGSSTERASGDEFGVQRKSGVRRKAVRRQERQVQREVEQQLHAGHRGRLELAGYPQGAVVTGTRRRRTPPTVAACAEPSLNPTLFSRISTLVAPGLDADRAGSARGRRRARRAGRRRDAAVESGR